MESAARIPLRSGAGKAVATVAGMVLRHCPAFERAIRSVDSDAGFSLVEVAVAAGIFAGALALVSDLVVRSLAAGLAARRTSYASLLAQQKVEELQALAFGRDAGGLPTTDAASDTARAPTSPSGGAGLSSSVPGSLDHDVAGFVDYVHFSGTRASGPADGAAFVRRWSIERPAGWADDGLVIQVFVTDRPGRAPGLTPGQRLEGEARLFTVRSRLTP